MDYEQFLQDYMSRPVVKEIAFPESEFQLRIGEVRKVMDEKGLDALLVTYAPNVSYLSGYQSFGSGWYSCLILPREGEPILHMHELEIGPAMLTSWVNDIRVIKWSYGGEAEGLASILKERSLEGCRIGIEPKRAGLSIDLYEGLKRALPDVTFIDASGVAAQPRIIKSPAEVDYMRQAAQITKKGVDAVLPVIRPGVTDNQMAAVLYHTLISEGSEYFSTQPIVSAGQRSGIWHTTFRRTPVQTGDTVILEFGAAYQRYTSAIMHAVSIGKPSSAVERSSKIINETLDLLFEAVKPGRTAHDVAREVGVGMNEISPVPIVLGYSIGLGLPPTWGEDLYFIREGIDLELKPGMTFHSPLTDRTPGTPGVGFSETWVVTETGCEILTIHDRQLTVVEV
ncbi:MAG: M24 family metallopeptidase [Mesorhizobium sp.]|uniref:M24 family metallopeptidase n=1 Tax=unclassified Mesorhizobium TaxID=325217 RepID=UPI000F759D40|nr:MULTISPECIES: Xaa-Pro peptidase family protein [unclassified Mesorhizobium]AZN98082.1 aminopeptidase P family protein [Mesorhizobium sp. M9A.F.Ca.ET.002.03.1.2]AZO19497.1 aminopeptidase P family protein [Mesorhizobium sp. M1E.F.Ca.ET.045.02.1.1]RWB43902.1 MAG: M24 family metallopeptidase [Mesorhizobium sp.]RWJ43575.1 MAG: M24 family metallopeptidase [Mesorhizobium sp.]RWJ79361.1 MAG: M24 family metallopeptidase [Mesorhizobium sp.]